MEKTTLYASYGSNMNLEQMAVRCPTAKVIGSAMLTGYQLIFRGVATVEPKKGGKVPIVVWSLEPRDEAALDRYEGYPSFYRKEYLKVEVEGKEVTAMIYIMNDGHEICAPSRYYYDVIRRGYRSAGFDTKPLNRAVERSMEENL